MAESYVVKLESEAAESAFAAEWRVHGVASVRGARGIWVDLTRHNYRFVGEVPERIMVMVEDPGVVPPDELTTATSTGVEPCVACTSCQSSWPSDRWMTSQPSFIPTECCITFCHWDCPNQRWCKPVTWMGPCYQAFIGPDQIATGLMPNSVHRT